MTVECATMKFGVTFGLSLVCYNLFVVAIDRKELCRSCVRADKCAFYGQMNKQDQEKWIAQNGCVSDEDEDVGKLFGFAPVAKGDYICCPEANVWGIEGASNSDTNSVRSDTKVELGGKEMYQDDVPENAESDPIDYDQNRSNGRRPSNREPGTRKNNHRQPLTHESTIQNPNGNYNGYPNGNIPNHNYPHNVAHIGPQGSLPNSRAPNQNRNGPQGNQARFSNSQNSYSPPPSFYRPPNFNNPNLNNPQNNPNSPINRPTNSYPNPAVPSYNVPQTGGPNSNYPNGPNFAGQNRNNQGRSINNGNINNQGQFQNQYGGLASGQQCSAVTSFPPQPQSDCCGKDAISDRNNGPQNNFLNRRPAGSNQNLWSPPSMYAYPRQRRGTRAAGNETVDVSVDNRITGGKETELHQFPWTALLKATFDYGDRETAFNCGGSVISSRYILTAAHCVQEDNARVTDVEVILAEYDKRSFPNDCVRVPGGGRQCIENIVMHAEDVIPHPQYDDRKLQNDIGLIRLRGIAPFTEFIRPICLPPIDIDNPDFSNLRVAIAGWGRNGRYTSQVKQSAVVHLVPQRECSASYPQLTRRHLCAAGHSGEDTCKGDSGGPLMMLYEGRYYISGVVSGKRADSPCGTSVPSLYTNVYHYLDWIQSNIRN